MRLFGLEIKKASCRGAQTEAQKFARKHPYGEAGSVDYWIEAMKRAYQLGEPRAQQELDLLVALTGPQVPRDWLSFPKWFRDLWLDALAPRHSPKDHPLAMPY